MSDVIEGRDNRILPAIAITIAFRSVPFGLSKEIQKVAIEFHITTSEKNHTSSSTSKDLLNNKNVTANN